MDNNVKKSYELAREVYASIGVDTDKVLENLKKIRISVNCWQGDDVSGFLFKARRSKCISPNRTDASFLLQSPLLCSIIQKNICEVYL